jgi:hypothetical protein
MTVRFTINALVLAGLVALGASKSVEAAPAITSLDSATWPSTPTQPNGIVFACGDIITINGMDLNWYYDPVVSLWDASGVVIEPEAQIISRSPTQIRVQLDASYPQLQNGGALFELRIRERRVPLAYPQIVTIRFYTAVRWVLVLNAYPLTQTGLVLVCK